MKILWHSNAPWCPTGYGQQTALFAKRLQAAGHDVAISAYYGLNGAGLVWNGLKVYPGDGTWNGLMVPYALEHGDGEPVLTITLMDVWVLDKTKLPENLACWVPVDHAPVPEAIRDFFKDTGARPIAMSQFGRDQLRDVGLDPLYVPHGYDPAVFYPRGKRECREKHGIPTDAFVVGMVAANKGTRKGFGPAFQAFAKFREKHRDAFLYVHTDITDQNGDNLQELARACGLTRQVIKFTDPLVMSLGEDANTVAELHSAFDVLLNPALGEGFGIPILEAQACGTPVIVTDWSAMPELCGSGWLVEGDKWWDSKQGSWFKCPSVGSIVRALNDAHDSLVDDMSAAALSFAADYTADAVMENYWEPTLGWLATSDRELVAA